MRTFRSGETNAPAVIISSGFLILCIAAAYYFIAVAPYNAVVIDDDSSSSSSSVTVTPSSVMTDDGEDASSVRSMTPSEKAAYDGCINAATAAHNQRWAAACEEKKKSQESAYLACIENKQDEVYCTAQFGGYESIGANCDLGTVRTATLNTQYAIVKQQCAS